MTTTAPDLSRDATLLIIDDEPRTVEVIAAVLHQAGCRSIHSTTEPEEAVALFQRCQPDLVVLDLIMPGRSGFEVLRELREVESEGAQVPIVILTADPSQEARREALESGASDFIIKPFYPAEVVLRVERLLEAHFLHRELRTRNEALAAEMHERQEAQARLRREHAELTDFFENAPTCLQWVDANGIILWANRAELDLGGYTAEEYLGHSITEFHADPEVIGDIHERLLRRETLREYPARLRCRDGSIKHVLINSNVFTRDGEFVHTRCFTLDVTERVEADRALRESLEENRRLATAIDHSATAVMLSDPNLPDDPLVFVNRAFTQITGYSAREALGRNARFMQGAGTDPEAVQRMREAMARRELFREPVLNYRKDGVEFWNELTVSPVFSPEGRLINFVGLLTDVTEAHRAREALRESEERFRQLTENIDAVFWMESADPGDLLYVSRAFEKIWGRSCEEVLRQPHIWEHALHPEHRERMIAVVRDRLLKGKSDGEYRIIRPDGSVRWISDRAFAIRDESGAIRRFGGIAVDITETKDAQDGLDRFFTLSLEKLATASFDGFFQRLNPAWETTLGWTLKELMAVPFTEFVHPDDLAATLAELERVKTGPAKCSFENRYRCRDGSYKTLRWTSRADFDRRLIYASARDVTKVNRYEAELVAARNEAERANAGKSDFLSRMSHELRTPLNAILGFGQILEMAQLEPGHRASVEQILKGGRHLLELINEVLQLSGIEAGRLGLSPEPVHVGDIMRETCDLIRPLAESRQIALEMGGGCGDWHVSADRQRLMQVLLNLTANAVKYNRDGGRVELACEEAPSRGWRISVIDDGIGISPCDMSRLFKPFERLDAHRTGIEGTGLGLALSKSLVEAMGGAIGVESEKRRGSTFWIELPVAEPPAAEPEAPPASEPAAATAPQAARILYIEDDLSNLRLIERIVAGRPDTELLSAMEGRLGLDLARQHRPELILLDLHLPDLEGGEVLRALLADPATSGIPVIMLSADATPRQIDRLLAVGARAYITKPINVRDFLNTLDQHLGRSSVSAS